MKNLSHLIPVLALGLCAFSADAAKGARKNVVAKEPEFVLPKGTKVRTYICCLFLCHTSSISDQIFSLCSIRTSHLISNDFSRRIARVARVARVTRMRHTTWIITSGVWTVTVIAKAPLQTPETRGARSHQVQQGFAIV